jgi:hypothetical protein
MATFNTVIFFPFFSSLLQPFITLLSFGGLVLTLHRLLSPLDRTPTLLFALILTLAAFIQRLPSSTEIHSATKSQPTILSSIDVTRRPHW